MRSSKIYIFTLPPPQSSYLLWHAQGCGNEVIDCNVDSMTENPKVPDTIRPQNYWGSIKSLPKGRTFTPHKELDEDWVEKHTDYEILTKWRNLLKIELSQ